MAETRREKLIQILSSTQKPISGGALSKELSVSRQVIVQDIALLRANGYDVISTNRGYYIAQDATCKRVFKVVHDDQHTQEEMNLFVDMGGYIENVFVYHKVYGRIEAKLDIGSRRDVQAYMDALKEGHSSLLKNVTSNYHYHTISAKDEATLDAIEQSLQAHGFLAELQEYEPEEVKRIKE